MGPERSGEQPAGTEISFRPAAGDAVDPQIRVEHGAADPQPYLAALKEVLDAAAVRRQRPEQVAKERSA